MNLQLFDDKYKILKVLGEGGSGTVYLAENIKFGALFAIKEISKKGNEKFNFLAEPNILKNLSHPMLPKIFDIIETEDFFYIIEDFIEGVTLEQELKRLKVFQIEKVIEYAKQICEVLMYLHIQKPNPIIYRDLKPANLILTSFDSIKLIDFGIAREYKKSAKSDTEFLGTKGYAAPEQYGANQTDTRTDIFSLGITIYELMTGLNPNEFSSFESDTKPNFNDTLKNRLLRIILKCTKKNPSLRYQSVAEVYKELNNIKRSDKIIPLNFSTLFMFILILLLLISSFIKINNAKSKKYQEYINNALGYYNNYKYDECIKYIRGEALLKIPSKKIDANLYYILGNAYYNENRFNEAEKYFKKAIDIDNKNELYKRDLALTYAKIGKLDLAIENIKNLSNDYSIYVKSEIYNKKGSTKEALANILTLISRTTDIELKKKAYILAATIYRDYKDSDSALFDEINLVEKALGELGEKDNIILLEMLGEAYYNKSNTEFSQDKSSLNEALKNFKKLITLGYKRPYVYRNIAIIYQELNEFDKCESILLEAKNLFPKEKIVYIQLAFLYLDIESKKPENKRDFKKVLDNYNYLININKSYENDIEVAPLKNKLIEIGLL